MTFDSAIFTAVREGGAAAGLSLLAWWLGLFDLPLPGNLPPAAAVGKPILAMTGGLLAYTLLPRQRVRRVGFVFLILAGTVASFYGYRYYNDVPATPDRVNLHLGLATFLLGVTYLLFGGLVRELISGALVVFRMQKPRGGA